MKIRRANISDCDEIRKLFYETIRSVNSKDYSPEQIEVWSAGTNRIERWTKAINEQHFFVAEIGEIIVGFASIKDDGYLDFMFVHKDFQGHGIATKLFGELEKVAEEKKLPKIWAHVSITARPFFARKGFELTEIFTTKLSEVEFEDSTMTKIRHIGNFL